MNVITRESERHVKTPFMSGVIENACSADVRSIGSLNVTVIDGVRFVPAPRGEPVTTEGRVRSSIVHVSFPPGAGSTFPARSTASERKAYRCPSVPKKLAEVAVVPTAPGTCVHPPALSLTSTVYDTMSVVPETGPHVIAKNAEVSYCGRPATLESGGLRSTIVHDWFVGDGVCTFPA